MLSYCLTLDFWKPLILHTSIMSLFQKMLYKWNHTVSKLWGYFHFIKHLNYSSCMYQNFFLFITLWYECTQICLVTHLLKDIMVVSSLGLWQVKLLWTFLYRYLCKCRFSFLQGKCFKCNFWVVYKCTLSLSRNYNFLHSHLQYISNQISLDPHQNFVMLLFTSVIMTSHCRCSSFISVTVYT